MGAHFGRVAQCASRALRGPQNARECAERHVRGTRAECVGRGSIARAALSARAVIARSGEWAALSAHFPRTCHAMPTQYNRGSTRVGRAEPQSPGTLRVKAKAIINLSDDYWKIMLKFNSMKLLPLKISILSLNKVWWDHGIATVCWYEITWKHCWKITATFNILLT